MKKILMIMIVAAMFLFAGCSSNDFNETKILSI